MNDTPTLTDRYIDAAMRAVPERQRADLAAELRASIADDIDTRIEAGEDDAAAERDVLTALGDPEKLAAGYTDRPLHLIGPKYFLDWKRLVVLLLWIVLPCAAFGVALGMTIAGEPVGGIIGTVAAVLVSAFVHVVFWTTLVFALVERYGEDDPKAAPPAWKLDDLPDPRPKGAGLPDMIATLVLLGLVTAAVLWDRFVGFVPGEPGLSFLDPGLWPAWIILLFVVIGLEAAVAVAVYAARRWTIPLAVANAVLNVVIVVPALWLLVEGRLLNAAFWPGVIADDPASAQTVAGVMAAIFGIGFAGIAVWDTIDAFLKARRRLVA